MNKYYLQDYLISRIPLNKDESLKADLTYIESIEGLKEYNVEKSQIITNDDKKYFIRLKTLMSLVEKEKFNSILKDLKSLDYIVIVDDMNLNNRILEENKKLLLKVYYHQIKKKCKNVKVYKSTNLKY